MRIVLAYSGGVRSTAVISWLKAQHRADVIAALVDLGDLGDLRQGRTLEAARDLALAAGAVRAHVVDRRETFAREFVLPSLRADAVAQGVPQPLALGRAAVAQTLVDIARIEHAVAVAHGADRGSTDAGRLERAVESLNPALARLAPPAEWAGSRDAVLEYARRRQVPLPAEPVSGAPQILDVNLWGRTVRADGAGRDVPLTAVGAHGTPAEPALIDVAFEGGTPVGVNGVTMAFAELVQTLTAIAGAHGVGRLPVADGWIDAPAAVVLHLAHRAMRRRMWPLEMQAFAPVIGTAYAGVLDTGGWFSLWREGLDAFGGAAQRPLTGAVRLRLFQSACEVVPAGDGTDVVPPSFHS